MAGRKWVDSEWVTQIPQLNGTFHPEPDDASQFPNRLAQQGLDKRINHSIKMPRWTVIIKHMHRALVQDVSQEREPNQATAKQRQGRLSCKRARPVQHLYCARVSHPYEHSHPRQIFIKEEHPSIRHEVVLVPLCVIPSLGNSAWRFSDFAKMCMSVEGTYHHLHCDFMETGEVFLDMPSPQSFS